MRGEIFDMLKRVMRARGMSYRDLGDRLGVSEPSIKRMFSQRDCKMSRLDRICDILDISLSDLEAGAERYDEDPISLGQDIELRFAEDVSLFTFFILLREGLSAERIGEAFGLDQFDLFFYARDLEAMALAEVGPGGAISRLEKRPIQFRHDGPLNRIHSALNIEFIRQCIETEARSFMTVSRQLRPETVRLIEEELNALRRKITTLARQDQLLSHTDELVTCKWSFAWGPVIFSELLEMTPHRKRASAPRSRSL